MISHLFLVFTILAPAALSFAVAERGDNVRLFLILTAFGIFFLSLLALLNDAVPFTAHALDDKEYYRASLVDFNTAGDWFNFERFSSTHEQRGYPLLLAWVHQACGDSLYNRKALNISFFLLLSLTWFAIGDLIGGRRLAFAFATAILVSTPLWFYWAFLRKDMIIIFLQSFFLLGVINYTCKKHRRRGAFLITIATLLVLPFRSQLALVNTVFLAMATFLDADSRRSLIGVTSRILLTAAVVYITWILTTNPDLLRSIGIAGAVKTTDLSTVEKTIDIYAAGRSWGFIKFILLYLFGELAGFHITSWQDIDDSFLRAISFLPWFYIGLPLFFLGMRQIISGKMLATSRPLLFAVIAFVALYAGVCWFSTDTVRWRMPGFPAMVAIAAFAWVNTTMPQRFTLFVGWGALSSFALILYYAIK